MKKLLFICFLLVSFIVKSQAQVWNPYYSYYCGFGYMPAPDGSGYYIGQIWYGYANGTGTAYFYDYTMGWTAYRGNFLAGRCHGAGEMICSQGYVAGYWNNGVFVQQVSTNQEQMQQSYNDIINQSSNNAPRNSNTITLPPDTEIKEIDSSSELGSKLLGKMRK